VPAASGWGAHPDTYLKAETGRDLAPPETR